MSFICAWWGLFCIKVLVWKNRRTEFIDFALQLDNYFRTVFYNQFQLICKHCTFHCRWNSGNNEEKWLKRHTSAFQASRTRDADNPQIQEILMTSLHLPGSRHEENWTQSCVGKHWSECNLPFVNGRNLLIQAKHQERNEPKKWTREQNINGFTMIWYPLT